MYACKRSEYYKLKLKCSGYHILKYNYEYHAKMHVDLALGYKDNTQYTCIMRDMLYFYGLFKKINIILYSVFKKIINVTCISCV